MVFCSLPCVGKQRRFGAYSIAGDGHTKNHQCKWSKSVLYYDNKKILHFFFSGAMGIFIGLLYLLYFLFTVLKVLS